MSVEMLNLDDLNPVIKQFQFKGVTYDICEIQLGEFIRMTAEQKSFEARVKDGSATEEDLLAHYRVNIKRMIPALTDEVLDSMTFRQVQVLMDFINASAVNEKNVAEAKK